MVTNVEVVIGSSFDDVIYAPGRSEQRLYGGSGNEALFGDEHDRLDGGDGNDNLFVWGGTAEGGPGFDTFWIYNSNTDARIDDFDLAEGMIRLGVNFRGVTPKDVQTMLDGSTGDEVDLGLLGLDGGSGRGIITLAGIDVADLSTSDFMLPG